MYTHFYHFVLNAYEYAAEETLELSGLLLQFLQPVFMVIWRHKNTIKYKIILKKNQSE